MMSGARLIAALCLGLPGLQTLAQNQASEPLPPQTISRCGTLSWRHSGAIQAIRFTPNGKQIITAARNGILSVWDRATGQRLRQLKGHRGEILSMDLSPKGDLALTGGSDGTVRIWNLQSGKQLQQFLNDKAWVNAVAISPNGKWAIAGTDSGLLHLWDLSTHRKIRTFGSESSIRSLAFSTDNKHIVTNGGKSHAIAVWNVTSGTLRRSFGTDRVSSVRFFRNGSWVISADYDHQILFWNAKTGKIEGRLNNPPDEPYRPNASTHLALAPNGKMLATGGVDHNLYLWSTETGKKIRTLTASRGTGEALAFSPDGNYLASGGSDHTLRIWDVKTGKLQTDSIGHLGAIHDLDLSPNGQLLATVGEDGTLRLWNSATGKQQWQATSSHPIHSVRFSKDGTILLAGDAKGFITLWDVKSGRKQHQWQPHRRTVTGLAPFPNGKKIASCSADRTVQVHDFPSGKEVVRISRPAESGFTGLVVLAEGRKLTTVSLLPYLRIWDAQNGKPLRELPGHIGGALAVVATPDGRTVISSGRDKIIRFQETASGLLRRQLPAKTSQTRCLAISPDGNVLASGDENGFLTLWDARTGKELAHLESHQGPLTAIAFSANGKTIATAGLDTTALIRDVEALVQAAKNRVIRLTPLQLEELWRDMAQGTGTVALEALQTMAQAPKDAIPFLAGRLDPVSEKRIQELLRDLGHRRYPTRQKANQSLVAMGRVITPYVQEKLKKGPSLEVRKRLLRLLSDVSGKEPTGEELRALRSLEVLEMAGTKAAIDLLSKLSKGASRAELTIEAKSTLRRMMER